MEGRRRVWREKREGREESCRWLAIWLLGSGPAAVPTSPYHADVFGSAGLGRGSRARQILKAPSKPVVAGSLCGVCIWTDAWQVGRYKQVIRGLRAPRLSQI